LATGSQAVDVTACDVLMKRRKEYLVQNSSKYALISREPEYTLVKSDLGSKEYV
jgi:hypothetical protein